MLQEMNVIRDQIRTLIQHAFKTDDFIDVFGDLQDTPDNSKMFHYGMFRTPKHPLGIIKTCEEYGLTCTVYQLLSTLEKPIVSRHGTKGGRFIVGMYACSQGLEKVLGMTIINDSGISSNHALIISKIDLGIDNFEISKEKEERFNFKSIMNIPVKIKNNDDHPSLNDSVYKGLDFRLHQQLYNKIQRTVNDTEQSFIDRVGEIQLQLRKLEDEIIERTKTFINVDEQIAGN
jgi:hypothetical protein